MKYTDVELGGIYRGRGPGLRLVVRILPARFSGTGVPVVFWRRVGGSCLGRSSGSCGLSSFARWATERIQS